MTPISQMTQPKPRVDTSAVSSESTVAGPTAPVVGVAPPPKLQRRPLLIAASAALIVLGALLSVWAYTGVGNNKEVTAVRVDIPRGSVVTRESLQVVRVGVDPALATVPAAQIDTLVGQRAAVDLKAGQLMVPGAVSAEVVPSFGNSVIGLSLGAGQLPGDMLGVGDRVRIVSTPGQQGDVKVDDIRVFDGVVVAVSATDSTGKCTVSGEVAARQAAELAARSATGKVAVLLDSQVS